MFELLLLKYMLCSNSVINHVSRICAYTAFNKYIHIYILTTASYNHAIFYDNNVLKTFREFWSTLDIFKH